MTIDQFYSNKRGPTQVNTNQHESTRINTSPTRANTSQTRVNTNQQEPDTSQHEPDTSQHKSIPVNTSQLDHEIYHSLS